MEYRIWIAALAVCLVLCVVFERRRCEHELIICVHGDEIRFRNWNRSVCIICEKPFPDLPEICAYTGESHTAYKDAKGSRSRGKYGV